MPCCFKEMVWKLLIIFLHIPLSKTQVSGYTYLQGVLGNVIFGCPVKF